jgi:amino acid transporter
MSLRVFHIIFIIVSVMLCLFVGMWGIREYLASRSGSGLTIGCVFLIFGFALVVYGKNAYRKLKEL